MPCDYSIDGEHLLVRTYVWGDVTDTDILDCQQLVEADPLVASDFSQLVDVRAVTGISRVTGRCLKHVAQRHFSGQQARSAFLVPRADRFGLAQLLDAYRQLVSVQQEVGVFHNLQQALVWLEVPPPPRQRFAGLAAPVPLLTPFATSTLCRPAPRIRAAS